MDKSIGSFIWDVSKEAANLKKHGVTFVTAAKVFQDAHRKIFTDAKHTEAEERFFCIGKVDNKIITVRFTYREGKIRIFGARYWRKGRGYYEKD